MNTNNEKYKIHVARYKPSIMSLALFLLLLCISLITPQSIYAETVPVLGQIDMVEEERIKEEFFRGRVLEVISTENQNELGDNFTIQKVQVVIGKEESESFTAEYSFHASKFKNRLLETGDNVVVVKTSGPIETVYSVSDVYRLNVLWVIIGLFFALVVFFAGKRGLFSFIGLGFTIFILMWYMVPRLADGLSPLRVMTVGVLLIASISLYISHGWRTRTHVAFVSTLVSIGCAYAMSIAFAKWMQLFGSGSEAAFYLQTAETQLDISGLFLAGVIIGALGILDDITTAQAATVEEIHLANPSLSIKEMYKRGLSVGKEHISSLVNTLVLAYAGASLPLLLLFYIYPRPLWVTLNSEMMIEEVMRTLVGSMTLVIAVPLTTILAAIWITRKRKIENN